MAFSEAPSVVADLFGLGIKPRLEPTRGPGLFLCGFAGFAAVFSEGLLGRCPGGSLFAHAWLPLQKLLLLPRHVIRWTVDVRSISPPPPDG